MSVLSPSELRTFAVQAENAMHARVASARATMDAEVDAKLKRAILDFEVNEFFLKAGEGVNEEIANVLDSFLSQRKEEWEKTLLAQNDSVEDPAGTEIRRLRAEVALQLQRRLEQYIHHQRAMIAAHRKCIEVVDQKLCSPPDHSKSQSSFDLNDFARKIDHLHSQLDQRLAQSVTKQSEMGKRLAGSVSFQLHAFHARMRDRLAVLSSLSQRNTDLGRIASMRRKSIIAHQKRVWDLCRAHADLKREELDRVVSEYRNQLGGVLVTYLQIGSHGGQLPEPKPMSQRPLTEIWDKRNVSTQHKVDALRKLFERVLHDSPFLASQLADVLALHYH